METCENGVNFKIGSVYVVVAPPTAFDRAAHPGKHKAYPLSDYSESRLSSKVNAVECC